MAVVGPGTILQDEVTPDPLLQGASEYEYVTILNPLTVDFQVQVAQDVPVNVPFEIRKDASGQTSVATTDERMATLNYGLNLKNPDHNARKRIFNSTIIPAGQTMNFKGNDAQVVVRQLVTEIMQRNNKARFLHDPVSRREVEEMVVVSRGSVQDLMDANVVTQQQQINQAIKASNTQPVEEKPFEGLDTKVEKADEPAPKRDKPAKRTAEPSV